MKKLIHKFLSHSISDSEKEELRIWLKDQRNYNIFKQYVRDDYDLTTLLETLDEQSAYDEVWNKINKTDKVRFLNSARVQNIVKYAAVVLVFLSIGYFAFVNTEDQIPQPVIVNNNIKPISNKAILTLQDGTSISLDEVENYESLNLTSNGEALIYKEDASAEAATTYNYLTIPRGGEFQVALSDGTRVWLNSDSQLKYPTSFVKGQTREVQLVYGEAYFDVSSSSNHDGAAFKVIAPQQEVKVLGTEFNIKAYYDEDKVFTTLVEGSIALLSQDREEILEPNQMATFNKINQDLVVNSVDVYNEISWRDNIYSFEHKPLKEIMKVLARWYDMEVEFENDDIENTRFNGVLDKKQNIEEIVENIKDLGFINTYEIYDKTLILK
ncbi:FecR family protein [Aestuariibaculum suncheonense]|uniref:FecR domain-containing protein n=1 Tax=Aestuariibaculum suncheonense TaxID=1028745 RepID=A0A8J6QDA7_9FLAO|nr:FecR domain-containing protein [Aestuariibaculum suncheonense]MBD0837010.1 FecR domain-containing protein [Aestuariibaculum suncheonense]